MLPAQTRLRKAMNPIRTPAFTLEPQLAAHAQEMFAVLSDSAIYEFENQPPQSLAWLQARFAKLESRRSPDGSQRWLNWVIRLPDARLAGYVQATVHADASAFIAYELASAYWRRGLGSAAVRAMIAELQSEYGVHELRAVLKAANYRSLALLRGLGFERATPRQRLASSIEADELLMLRDLDSQA
jgi:[ribosomal protein S5]-alanine N-acetyltransferase